MRNRFHAGCFNNGASSVPFPEARNLGAVTQNDSDLSLQVVFAIQNWLRDLLKLAPGEELRPVFLESLMSYQGILDLRRSEDFLFVTCGNWDDSCLDNMFEGPKAEKFRVAGGSCRWEMQEGVQRVPKVKSAIPRQCSNPVPGHFLPGFEHFCA